MGIEENKVKKGLKYFLEQEGYKVYRINNIPGGRFRHIMKKGICDIIALKKGSPALFIEAKKLGGKISKEQLEFLELINTSSTLFAICVESSDHFKNFYKRTCSDFKL